MGCWAGAFAAMAIGKARNVTAVDIEPLALEVARSRAAEVRFVDASVLSLPFAESSFDVVTFWENTATTRPVTSNAFSRAAASQLRKKPFWEG